MKLRDALLTFSVDRPKWVFALLLLLCLLAGLQIPSIKVDTDPENMLPHDQVDRVFHDQVKERFVLYDMIVVGMVNTESEAGIYNPKSLEALHRLSEQIGQMKGVVAKDMMALDRVDNITQEGPGTIRFEWMMRDAPTTLVQAAQIRQAVERLPLLDNTLVSGDGRAAGIYVPIESKSLSYQLSQQIEEVIAKLGVDDQFHIAGLPVSEDTFGVEMFVQMAISAPLAGLMIFILMWVFFRSLLLITAPMLVAMASVIITMGLLIGQGYTVHIMSSMIPIFLMPIAVVDSVHILSEFADRYRPGENARPAVLEVLGHLFTPMLYTSLTSAVGFASLAFTPIPPVQIFGLHVAFGIMLAFLLTVTLVPAYIISLSPKRMAQLKDHNIQEDDNSRLGRLMALMGRLSMLKARLLIVAFSLLTALSVWGVSQIQINDNPVRWFKSDHRLRVADRVLNAHFSGTYDAYLVFDRAAQEDPASALNSELMAELEADPRGAQLKPELQQMMDDAASTDFDQYASGLAGLLDEASFSRPADEEELWLALFRRVEAAQIDAKYFLNPEVLAYLDALARDLESQAQVGKVNSLPVLVKTVYRELTGGGDEQFRLPDSARGVAQTILSYQSSHRPDDLWHFVTPDYRSTLLWLQLKSGDNQDMTDVINHVSAYIDAHPLPQGLSVNWAGLTYINVVWQEQMVNGMLKSLMSAFVMVLVMMIVLFRSFSIGLLAMLPLSVTILFIYGLIGFVGKDYDMPIAVLSALTLGLSVDFAIHYLERARAIYRQCGSWPEAIAEIYKGPSRAISRNAIVIAIGFTPLLLAPLVPYITVGFFLASIMAVSALVTLLLLPAVITLIGNKEKLFGTRNLEHESA
ncbi:MMPL family transporter [Marinobacterium sp. D7]|uniref:efflux RND transporter permease subunit n=1 Tax=Marinobacterium ramblicola TaxID=2849041 RepID=UPI001C2DCFFF|nr:MMPL family transporter [Marinobacterium ramblicola]MBV1786474.1 MMPL family transporter [Marinobacterium ramblicola]